MWYNLYNTFREFWQKDKKEDVMEEEYEKSEEEEEEEEEIPPLVVLEPSRDILRPWRSESFVFR